MTVQAFSDRLITQLQKPSTPKKMDINCYPPTPPPDTPTSEANNTIAWSSNGSTSHNRSLSPTEPESIVAVIGVGYVGTHLVEAFAHHYKVIAFDLSEKRLQVVAEELPKGLPIQFTSDASNLGNASHILVSVPTVLNDDKTIDTTYLRSAISMVERYVKPGSTVVIESSVAVGMTRQLVGPLMASKNLKVGMSPERVDPGRTVPAFEDIPKIVSGLDAASLESISQLYGRVFGNMLAVSSPEVAEMTKLYENCQRMVCAAYANEMADACAVLGINAFEVSQAAASKPFGYLPFRPGPGIGGHCIPVNPYYLFSTCSMPLLEHATTMSWSRPADVANRFVTSLLQEQELPKASFGRILVVGVGFKRGQSVMSNSPGAAIIKTLLSEHDLYVEFADPLVSAEQLNCVPKMDTTADWNAEYLSTFHGIIVAVDQEGLDLDVLDQLQGVKVQDYSGRQKKKIISTESVPKVATIDAQKMLA